MATNPIPFVYPEEVPFEGLEEVIAYDSLGPEELLLAEQQQTRMLAILGQHISPRQVQVIVALYIDECSVDEAALRLHLMPRQVINARNAAMKKLRTVKGLQVILGGK